MSEKVKAANATRGQKAKAKHDKAMGTLKSDARAVKAIYLAEKESPLVEDMIKKAEGFIKYFTKIAQDGTGARKTGHLLENGNPEVENYFLTPAERVSHLDKAAGVQVVLDYIQRQISLPDPDSQPKKPAKAE